MKYIGTYSAPQDIATKANVDAAAATVLGTDGDASTKATVYGARVLAQQAIDDAAAATLTAGNGINIANKAVSAKVVAGNGLSLTANGITMAIAGATPGAVKADTTTIKMASDGTLSVGNIDCGEIV